MQALAVSGMIRRMGRLHWLALFLAVLLSWVAVWLMSAPAEMRSLSAIYGAEFWASLCAVGADGTGFVRLWAMWSLMAGAMMLPTALPAFATFDEIPKQQGGRFGFLGLVAGYMAIWIGGSAVFAGVQIGLAQSGLADPFGASLSRWFSAAILLGAGLYQFSALKDACLAKCRMPLTFFMQHWAEGPLRMGLRLGAVCLGCCWALMALGFVGGVQSIAFMGVATVLMIFEKLPDFGRYLTRPLGIALIGAGLIWPFN